MQLIRLIGNCQVIMNVYKHHKEAECFTCKDWEEFMIQQLMKTLP